MLYVAREDEPHRHRGAVVRVHRSGFAPGDACRGALRVGGIGAGAFRVAYVRQLRELWRRDPGAFLSLIDQAEGVSDLTLVDDFGDAPHAPRRILAATLKQIAASQREEARRRARRSAGLTPRWPSPAAP